VADATAHCGFGEVGTVSRAEQMDAVLSIADVAVAGKLARHEGGVVCVCVRVVTVCDDCV